MVWYPHKDALSLLPPDVPNAHANHLLSRGAIVLRPGSVARWSWLG